MSADFTDSLSDLIARYDTETTIVRSTAYSDGGSEPLFPRLDRAAGNQAENGGATWSRYGIWANTARDGLIEAINALRSGDEQSAVARITKVANSLSAFAEIQRSLDPDSEA